jgi:hypothetical protein
MLRLPLLFTSFLPVILPVAPLAAAHHPELALHNITYSSEIIYSTPAHLAVAYATIDFNLTNTAIPYTTYCTASSEREFNFFYGEIVYNCNTPAGVGVGPDASANFTFNQPDGTFNVNQTWDGGRYHGRTSVSPD